MEGVQGPSTDTRDMCACKSDRSFKYLLRQLDFRPKTFAFVVFELIVDLVSFSRRHLSAKDVLFNRVYPFSLMQGSKPESRKFRDAALHLSVMGILHV